MRRRRIPPSLKSKATQLLAQLSTNAFHNIFVEESAENVRQRKRTLNIKRKRSYSCDDYEKGILNKRLKVGETSVDEYSKKQAKRKFDDGEDDENVDHKRKRQKLEHFKHMKPQRQPFSTETKPKDDTTVSYHSSNSKLDVLNRYFHNLPTPCWDNYSDQLVKNIIRDIKTKTLNKESLRNLVEYITCEKLVNFSTKSIEAFAEDLEDKFYSNLKFCRNLLSLEITFIPSGESSVIKTTMGLQRLRFLQTLHLLPNTQYSYHWALEDISQHCSKLRELKIIYNGDSFSENQGIDVLKSCQNLCAIWFFNYGRKSETKSLSELLRSLTNVKILFHKELPNAILELTNDDSRNENEYHINFQPATNFCCLDSVDYITDRSSDSRTAYLGLERVDLCWYQQGVGYQLVYVPSSYLLRVAQTCPKISLINLIGSTCLSQIISRLPNLQAIILQQTSFASSLRCTLKDSQLDKLTVLRVSDVWDITYDMISYVAQSCPNLQVLSISCSSLEARGQLVWPSRRSPFSRLRHLTLVPGTLEDRPSLTAPSAWQLGTALTKYVLQDATLLTHIHLQYKQDDLAFEDMPTGADLEEVLCVPRPELQSLLLEWPPAVSRNFVSHIVEACPDLSKLGCLITWPLANEQCAFLITSFGYLMDIS